LLDSEQEVMALKLSAQIDNRGISRILGISEDIVDDIVGRSLRKLALIPS
jgi:hypothetical protein